MKRSILKLIASGIVLASLVIFMPFILVGAVMLMLISFIFFRLFFVGKMRKAFAARMIYMNNTGLRRRNYTYDAENQVIYLSPKNFN